MTDHATTLEFDLSHPTTTASSAIIVPPDGALLSLDHSSEHHIPHTTHQTLETVRDTGTFNEPRQTGDSSIDMSWMNGPFPPHPLQASPSASASAAATAAASAALQPSTSANASSGSSPFSLNNHTLHPPVSVALTSDATAETNSNMPMPISMTETQTHHADFLSILAEMPTYNDDSTRHGLWMEAVRFKTKTLELAIAEARRKEREAELELARLKAVVDRRSSFRHGHGTITTGGEGTGSGTSPVTTTGLQPNQGNLQPQGQTSLSGGGMATLSGGDYQTSQNQHQNQQRSLSNVSDQAPFVSASTRSHSFTTATYPYLHTRPMLGPTRSPQPPKPTALPLPENTQPQIPSSGGIANSSMLNLSVGGVNDIAAAGREQAMTPFDLEALAQPSAFDQLFNWLPDFGANPFNGVSSGTAIPQGSMSGITNMMDMSGGIDPNSLRFTSHNPLDALNGSAIELDNEFTEDYIVGIKSEPSDALLTTPVKRKGSSGAESVIAVDQEDHLPPIKRSRRGIEKKVTVEQAVVCSNVNCRKPICRTMVRAIRSQLPDPIRSSFTCTTCHPIQTSFLPDPAISGGATIGTVESRKRSRVAMEVEDEEQNKEQRRQFCDICQRIIAVGMVRGGKDKVNVGHLAEIICTRCDSRYQRCTDCGGGGGPRLNVGKWRLKEVFQPGRKTCGLSHSRQRDIGVHVTPSDFTPEQLNEVLTRCKALWQEKNLSRLAVPEMMEMDLPPNLINPLHSYADIEKIIVENWPSREAMIKAEGADPNRFKRILGLTWAHTKPRRTVRTVDIEEEQSMVKSGTADGDGGGQGAGGGVGQGQGEGRVRGGQSVGEEEDMGTVLDNVRKTNVVIPAGCELIGMWGGEWDMQHGSLLISTFIPFESTDGEDSAALSVGEIISRVQKLQQSMNADIQERFPGKGEMLVPACEHLWVVSGSTVPLVRERMADILTKKRSFVHLEEYLTRHPDFANAVKVRPYGLHPTSLALPQPPSGQDQIQNQNDSDNPNTRPLILARWLGNDFRPEKIAEIKEVEFGGKAKMKRKAKKVV